MRKSDINKTVGISNNKFFIRTTKTRTYLRGVEPISFSFSTIAGFPRKSVLVPTRMKGVSGQWCFTSGVHFDETLRNDDDETTEKHTRNRSVFGYESGRNLSTKWFRKMICGMLR